jgi:hypothetical protein
MRAGRPAPLLVVAAVDARISTATTGSARTTAIA